MKKPNVPYGSATLKGCTAPADLCTSKYVDGAGIEPTSLHRAHSVMFHPRILPARIKKMHYPHGLIHLTMIQRYDIYNWLGVEKPGFEPRFAALQFYPSTVVCISTSG